MSDASGSWGCGAYTSTGEWFQLRWLPSWESIHIMVKELLPIAVAAAIWGKQWEGRSVRCRCDNAATVAIINSGRSKVERAMHVMRSMYLFLACHNTVFISLGWRMAQWMRYPGINVMTSFCRLHKPSVTQPSCPKQSGWPWCCSSYLTAR